MNKYFKYILIMKRFLLTIMMMLMVLVSCGTTNYVSRRTVNEMDEISYVLANYYPQLHTYYMEGVMDVTSMKEIILEDGTVDYKINYHFIRYYYRNYSDKMDVVRVHFPELYDMYTSGVIEINSVYKYVDKNTGAIRHHCSYNRVYDYYYHYYPRFGGTHLYYRARPIPPPRPRVEPAPRPGQNPPPPRPREDNVRPNNPPRQTPNTNSRPQVNPGNRSRGSSSSSSSRSGQGRRR